MNLYTKKIPIYFQAINEEGMFEDLKLIHKEENIQLILDCFSTNIEDNYEVIEDIHAKSLQSAKDSYDLLSELNYLNQCVIKKILIPIYEGRIENIFDLTPEEIEYVLDYYDLIVNKPEKVDVDKELMFDIIQFYRQYKVYIIRNNKLLSVNKLNDDIFFAKIWLKYKDSLGNYECEDYEIYDLSNQCSILDYDRMLYAYIARVNLKYSLTISEYDFNYTREEVLNMLGENANHIYYLTNPEITLRDAFRNIPWAWSRKILQRRLIDEVAMDGTLDINRELTNHLSDAILELRTTDTVKREVILSNLNKYVIKASVTKNGTIKYLDIYPEDTNTIKTNYHKLIKKFLRNSVEERLLEKEKNKYKLSNYESRK